MSAIVQALIASFASGGGGGGGGGGDNHRYWRLYLFGLNYIGASEIEFRSSIGGSDQCSGGTATASDYYVPEGLVPSNAFDNNAATHWASNNTFPCWIKYDFGAGNDKDIVEVSYKVRDDISYTQAPTKFYLQYSDDDSTWTTKYVFLCDTWVSAGQVQIFNYAGASSVPSRYVRIKLISSSYYVGASEIEFRSSIGGADQCSGGTVIVSSSYPGLPASNAFDNNEATEWANNGDSPKWIGYDFGAGNDKDIVEVSYRCRNSEPAQTPSDVVVQVSSDGSSWVTYWYVESVGSWTGGQTKVFTKP